MPSRASALRHTGPPERRFYSQIYENLSKEEGERLLPRTTGSSATGKASSEPAETSRPEAASSSVRSAAENDRRNPASAPAAARSSPATASAAGKNHKKNQRYQDEQHRGIGSVPGAVIGAFIIGLCENLIKSTEYTVFSDAFTFALLIVILVFKPTGLFGEKVTDKV